MRESLLPLVVLAAAALPACTAVRQSSEPATTTSPYPPTVSQEGPLWRAAGEGSHSRREPTPGTQSVERAPDAVSTAPGPAATGSAAVAGWPAEVPREDRYAAEGPLAGSSAPYAMVYFPLAGAAARPAETPVPFGSAPPGYGIYTYILRGNLAGPKPPGDVDSYAELMRVIETYVVAAGRQTLETKDQAHTFLVPAGDVPAHDSASADDAPDLPQRLRLELVADYLRAAGRNELAEQVERATGPFLVSSLEPRLIPGDTGSPRLLVDLTDVGPEYAYSVVDAYDRLIPPEQVGAVDGLIAIRDRLMAIFPDLAIDATAGPAPQQDWVHMLGQRRGSVRGAAAGEPVRTAVAETGAGSDAAPGAL